MSTEAKTLRSKKKIGGGREGGERSGMINSYKDTVDQNFSLLSFIFPAHWHEIIKVTILF